MLAIISKYFYPILLSRTTTAYVTLTALRCHMLVFLPTVFSLHVSGRIISLDLSTISLIIFTDNFTDNFPMFNLLMCPLKEFSSNITYIFIFLSFKFAFRYSFHLCVEVPPSDHACCLYFLLDPVTCYL